MRPTVPTFCVLGAGWEVPQVAGQESGTQTEEVTVPRAQARQVVGWVEISEHLGTQGPPSLVLWPLGAPSRVEHGLCVCGCPQPQRPLSLPQAYAAGRLVRGSQSCCTSGFATLEIQI